MLKFKVTRYWSALFVCTLAVSLSGCSHKNSSSPKEGEGVGSAGSGGDAGAGGSGGDSGGDSSKGGTTNKKTKTSKLVGGETGAGGDSSTGGVSVSGGSGGAGTTRSEIFANVTEPNVRAVLGGTTIINVKVGPTGLGVKDVRFTLQGLPPGVGYDSVNVATGSESAQLQIKVGESAKLGGPYAFTILVTSNADASVTASITGTLYVVDQPGKLDVSFGTAGVYGVTVIPKGTETTVTKAVPNSINIDSKGRILVGGSSKGATSESGWVVRLDQEGKFDSTFSKTGILENIASPNYSVDQILVDNELLYVTTAEATSSGTKANLRRFTGDGSKDQTFNSGVAVSLESTPYSVVAYKGGVLLTPSGVPKPVSATGGFDSAFSVTGVSTSRVATDSLNRIVYSTSTANGHQLGRLLATGIADATFGASGLTNFPCPTEGKTFGGSISTTLLGADESILALVNCGASAREPYLWETAVIRLTPAGMPLESFGEGGRRTVTSLGMGLAAIMQPDGKVVVLYSAYSTSDAGQVSELKLRRFNGNGSVDSIFGSSGIVNLGTGATPWNARAMAYDAGAQRVVVLLQSSDSPSFNLVRVWL